MTQMLSGLIPGETMEIPEAYIGQNQKLPARVIIHRLTDDQTQIRLKNQEIREKKKGIVMKDKSKRLMSMHECIYHEHVARRSTDELRAFIIFTSLAD